MRNNFISSLLVLCTHLILQNNQDTWQFLQLCLWVCVFVDNKTQNYLSRSDLCCGDVNRFFFYNIASLLSFNNYVRQINDIGWVNDWQIIDKQTISFKLFTMHYMHIGRHSSRTIQIVQFNQSSAGQSNTWINWPFCRLHSCRWVQGSSLIARTTFVDRFLPFPCICYRCGPFYRIKVIQFTRKFCPQLCSGYKFRIHCGSLICAPVYRMQQIYNIDHFCIAVTFHLSYYCVSLFSHTFVRFDSTFGWR